jgi:hypothetical protein
MIEKVTSGEDIQEFFEGIDQNNIKLIRDRIDLANELVNEIDNKMFSGKAFSIIELKKLKQLALQYQRILKKISTDPKFKIFLHLSSNEDMQDRLFKRLDESIINAVDGLKINIKVIESKIELMEIEQHEQLPKTFLTVYNREQLMKLRKGLINGGFIDDSIAEDEFIYLFSGKPITKEIQSIKWRLPRGLTALRELISLLTGETVHKNQVRLCFKDYKDKPCVIPKPKINEYSKHYIILERIVNSIKP